MTAPAASAPDVLLTRPRITVDGADLAARWLDQLLAIRVRCGLRSTSVATLTFADPGYALTAAGVLGIGSDVVLASATGQPHELLRGAVTAVSSEVEHRTGAVAVVTVHDASHDLTRRAGVETFQDVTLTDLVTTLLQQAGLRATLALPPDTIPYALRNDTPLGLIDEIATRTGRDWAVAEGTFAVWPAATGNAPGAGEVPLSVGVDLDAFSVRQAGDAPTEITVRGWDPQAQRAVTGTASTPQTRAGLTPADAPGKRNTRVDARAATRSASDAASVAQALAARTGRVVARGRAEFTPALRVGGTVAIDGAGPGNGRYYVREVTHTFDGLGARTSFVAGDRDPVLLSDPWAAPPVASSFRRSGLAVGVVDNINDPQHLGRVSVSLATASDLAKSTWARVLGVGAGAGRGNVVLPEVGDEVLIGFEDDDVCRPVVLGGLFGQSSTLPGAPVESGRVVTRGLTSRLGHVLELSDGTEPSAQHVLLALAGGEHRLRLGKDRLDLEAPAGVPLTIKVGTASIDFDGNGGIVVDATKITLKAQQALAVQSTGGDVSVKATTSLALSGTTASLKAQAQGVVESAGVQEVKGAIVKIN
jgi:uncharacterized protein involved in type VI secretion and phage assembly